jgi:hypothetical protein
MASPPNNISVVDFLKSKGLDSTFPNRKKLAKKLGIQNYTGTPNQNKELIDKINTAESSQPTSVVDFLKSKGLDSTFPNRKKLAEELGIQNYTGTADQNKELIDKINTSKSSEVNNQSTNPTPLDVENASKKEAEQIKSDINKIPDVNLSAIENATPNSLKPQGSARLSGVITTLGKKIIIQLMPIAIDIVKQFITQIIENEITKAKSKASQEQQTIQSQINILDTKRKNGAKGLDVQIGALTAKKEAIPIATQTIEDNLRAQLVNFGSFSFNELPNQIPPILETVFADGCPNSNNPTIERLITTRDGLVTSLNIIGKQLNTLTLATTGLNTFLGISQTVIDALKTTKTSTSLAVKAIPSPPGVPGVITSTLSDLETIINKLLFEKDGTPRLPKVASSIASASIAISLINLYIQQIVGILSALDFKLKQCDPNNTLIPISDDLISIAVQQTQADNTINQVTYAGFLIEIEEVPYTPTVNRRRAVGKNQSGITLIQTELSFTTQDEILINELKLIIDRDNLKAY